jgi:hypothetical protein
MVGTIVNDTLAEDRSRQVSVGLFGVHFRELPIQHEIVTLRPETDGHLPPKEDKREDFAILLTIVSSER